MSDLTCNRIQFTIEGQNFIYEGEAAQKYYDWLLGCIRVAEIHGMVGERPAPTRVELRGIFESTTNAGGREV